MMPVEPGVRGVECPLRAERERADSVAGGEEYKGEVWSYYFICQKIYLNSRFGDFCILNRKSE